MFILEQEYGNDGYAFWFKLLEMLGNTEGHCLKLASEADWRFLAAKTRLEVDICRKILDLLAVLGAIDPELWEKEMVWSDNFVANISDAYRKRAGDTPVKPSFRREKPQVEEVSDGIGRRKTTNKTILNETISDKNIVAETETGSEEKVDEVGEGENVEKTINRLVLLYNELSPATGNGAIATNVRRNKEIRAALLAGCPANILEETVKELGPLEPPWEVRKEALRRAGLEKKRERQYFDMDAVLRLAEKGA
jgi:hypothetical protein